jgi:hypothetical protein
MDLAPSQTEYFSTYWAVMGFGDGVHLSPSLYPNVLLRRNVLRQVDGISDPPGAPQPSNGVDLEACGTLTMEENVVDLPAAHSIQYEWCVASKFFANLTSGGALIQGYSPGTSTNASELSTNIDDASVLAF